MIGITILDVVEGENIILTSAEMFLLTSRRTGSALEALEGMNGLISNQPKGFESVEAGIEWQYVMFHRLTLKSWRRQY